MSKPSPSAQTGKDVAAPDERARRQAEALRANLARRKAQARARAEDTPPDPPDAESPDAESPSS